MAKNRIEPAIQRRAVNVKPAELSIKGARPEGCSKQTRLVDENINRFLLLGFVRFRLPATLVYPFPRKRKKKKRGWKERKSRRGTLILWNVTEQRLSRRAVRSSFSELTGWPSIPDRKELGQPMADVASHLLDHPSSAIIRASTFRLSSSFHPSISFLF